MNDASPSPIGMALSGGRYVITEQLGEGGMATVYRATDHNIQADVVIKLPHRAMATDAEFTRRFRDEVRSLVRLSHPHIVKVTDVGEWEGAPFAVLQFLPGGSLQDRLAAWRGPAALATLGSWLGPVGGTLDYIHSQKLVHRDVKPGNILFDAQGHALLGDFGVAKVLAAADGDRSSRTAMTGTGLMIGTPQYMAPELIMGDPIDGRVDQYALAVTAYELVCGRRPFEHGVGTRVLLMQAQDTPPSVAGFSPWATPRLEAALLKGLAKDPADRFPTCAAFAAAVVEAAGVGPAGRARLRCESCGQPLTISVEDLSRLSRDGDSAPCPKCRSLLNPATLLPPNDPGERTRGGTAALDDRGGTAEFQPLKPQTAASTAGRGTVALGRVPASPVAKPRPEPPDGDAGEDVVENEPARPPLRRIPRNVAAAAVALLAGTALIWASSGRSEAPDPPTPRVVVEGKGAPAAEPIRSLIARNDASVPRAPAPSVKPMWSLAIEPSPAASPADSRVNAEPEAPAAPSNPKERADPPGEPESRTGGEMDPPKAEGSEPNVIARRIEQVPKRVQRQGGAVPELKSGAEPVGDDEGPSQRNVPLHELQSHPAAFAGQLITLEQVYCVGRVPWRMPDGSLRVDMIESDLDLTANSAQVRLGEAFELGLDRGLAVQLARLGKMSASVDSKPASPEWIMQPANLTVRVSDSPGPNSGPVARIVRIELFEGFKNEVRGSAKKFLVVLFITQTVTPAGTSGGLGNNDEWKKVRKLGHAYNQFQRVFESNQRQNSLMKWTTVSNQLNQLIGAGISQSAAAQAETQRQIMEMTTPQPPR